MTSREPAPPSKSDGAADGRETTHPHVVGTGPNDPMETDDGAVSDDQDGGEYIELADGPDALPELDDDWPRMSARTPQELSTWANERRKAERDVAWMPWGIVESAVEAVRGVDDPDDLDRSLDTLVATLKLLLGPSRLRMTLPRWSIKPDRTGRLVIRKHSGGRRQGSIKGQPWTRRECLEWWGSWTELDGKPIQKQLAIDMGLSVKSTKVAVGRWRATKLHWPPTNKEIEELAGE
jgi:hypothetical protein